MKNKIIIGSSIILLLLIATVVKTKHISPVAIGLHDKMNHDMFSDVAANGYDVTTYFTEQNPMKGSDDFATRWNDGTWKFASQQSLGLFKENPEYYAPQFGGFCSFAMSKGFTAATDPNSWTIYEGKLYLFNDMEFKKEFDQDPKTFIEINKTTWNH